MALFVRKGGSRHTGQAARRKVIFRSGELLSLTPADILPSKLIDINKNDAKLNGEELFLEPKTPKARRCISIPDFLYDDIQEYLSKLYGIEKGDRIFYFTKSALDKEIKRIAAKLGLPIIRVHDLSYPNLNKIQTFWMKYGNHNKYRLKRFGFYFWCMISL